MDIAQIDPPTGEVLTLQEMMDHLNLWEVEPEDERRLEGFLLAAYSYLDGREGILGRSLLLQSWDYRYEGCLHGRIELPFPPIQSILGLSYLDAKQDVQDLDLADFQFRKHDYRPYIQRKKGRSWPGDMQENTLQIRYSAGYGVANTVPRPLRMVIQFLVAHWFENRVAVERCKSHELPFGVEMLLQPYRMNDFSVAD